MLLLLVVISVRRENSREINLSLADSHWKFSLFLPPHTTSAISQEALVQSAPYRVPVLGPTNQFHGTILPENPVFVHVVKKFPCFHGTQNFINENARECHVSKSPSLVNPYHTLELYFVKPNFCIKVTSTFRSFKQSLSFRRLDQTFRRLFVCLLLGLFRVDNVHLYYVMLINISRNVDIMNLIVFCSPVSCHFVFLSRNIFLCTLFSNLIIFT